MRLGRPPLRRGLPALAALAVAGGLLALVIARANIRTGLADFLPEGRSPAARLLLPYL